ncbi:DUF6629 family protein [Rhodoferax sp. WC2427]|uniref:DUF6629 family protein n=1 Tax=Rhodoferax sp. WC2427 TaxID=3234144 RepID=UPI0034667C24
MCFSATASFTASVFLAGVGSVTWTQARTPGERPFAAIPLLFALQQAIEGVIWLTFRYQAPALNVGLTYAYVFFSHVLWPVFVPVAVLLLEPPGRRRRTLVVFVLAGSVASAWLLYQVLVYGVVSQPLGQHIAYLAPHFFAVVTMLLYVVSTTVSLLLSTQRMARVFGGLALLSLAVAYGVYSTWFISVWCYLAAMLSGVVLLHFKGQALLQRWGQHHPLGS